MRDVKKNLDKLDKNITQVKNLAKKDEHDKFDEVMSGFYQTATQEYSLCTTLKGLLKFLYDHFMVISHRNKLD